MIISNKKTITLSDLYGIIDLNLEDTFNTDLRIANRSYREICEELDKQIFTEAKKLYKSTTEIGNRLGINQSTVSRKLRKYHI